MRPAPADDSDFHRNRLATATAAKIEAMVRELRTTHLDAAEMDGGMAEILAHLHELMHGIPEQCRKAIPGLADSDIAILDREIRAALSVRADYQLVGRRRDASLAAGRRR